jgi:predicted small secreted protein
MNVLRVNRLALLVALSLVLVGCNTIEGAGRDIEVAGEAVQETARDARD